MRGVEGVHGSVIFSPLFHEPRELALEADFGDGGEAVDEKDAV